MRVLVPVTGAFYGRLRVRRSSGRLDTEGLERVLSEPSIRAISLAKQLDDAELVAVHVDKGDGELILREAMSHGMHRGILIEGARVNRSDAGTRAQTMAEVYKQNGPFDAVIGPARSEFAGFSGALAALAGNLEIPIVVGARAIAPDGDGFTINYRSIFGDYDLHIPRPCVVLAGDVPASHPTAWDIHDAHRVHGILRVAADTLHVADPVTTRERLEPVPRSETVLEEVDGTTLVRRLRSRSLVPEQGGSS